jgi:hypothetical protein
MTVSNRRRGSDRRMKDIPVPVERRSGIDRREPNAEQLQTVIDMLAQVAETASIGDEDRRTLDQAIMRLRFVTERLAND